MRKKTGTGCLLLLGLMSVCGLCGMISPDTEKNSVDYKELPAQETKQEEVAEKTPEQVQAEEDADRERERQGKIQKQFSVWDGSHYGLVKLTKLMMNDPDSFKHVSTRYIDMIDTILVTMTYRGTNGFGAVVTENIQAEFDLDGNFIQFIIE